MRTASVYRMFRHVVSFALVAGTLAWSFSMTGCGGSSTPPPPPPLLSIPSATLSDGTIGATYTQTIQATGGVAPFTWTVSAGSLPHGLSLGSSSSNVVTISGTPDIVQAGATFTIQVMDTHGQSAVQSYSMNVKNTIVQTQSGAVQGVVVGNELLFRGIPYAEPPVGNLRWQPPRPPLPWTRHMRSAGITTLH